MSSSSNQDSFLSLVRSGIGHSRGPHPNSVDWLAIAALANQQGLSAIVIDGIEKLPEGLSPPKVQLLQWIGEVLQSYEFRYELYERAVAELAGFYNEHHFNMMVLKGYACSLNWPKPEHRPCGDIDIWLFGKQKEADALILKELGLKVDSSRHHHTVFNWRDFSVENHYDFVNVHARKSSRKLERIFKELGQDDSHYVELKDEKVYLPTPNLHALFLIRHMLSHFAAAEITLRQVLDWGFFTEKHTKEIDWQWLEELLVKYHMIDFYNCINAICVGDLGFNVNIFPRVQFYPDLKDKILADILAPAYSAMIPQGFFKRVVFKFRRWQGNSWKQKLCYGESRCSLFWSGIRAKLLKPASI